MSLSTSPQVQNHSAREISPTVKTDFDNRLIDQFEDDIKAGKSPEIERCLARLDDDSKQRILFDLISIEVFHGVRKGRNVVPADYSRFGEEAENFVRKQVDDLKATKGSTDETLAANANAESTVEHSIHSQSQTIGPYKLLEKIGEGGMGSVWKAQQEKPVRRQVAIKLIKSGVADQQTIARFEAERQALAMMDHETIAKVLDAGTTAGGTPYFVMMLVDGDSITKFCDVNKLKLDDRLNLFVQACDAVQHAHHKGIVHRDLKPSNILVHIHNGQPTVKVIDFGLAKAIGHQTRLTDNTVFTEFGNILGTLQYMSPEQASLNSIDIDTRTDVYSLGVILYELLAGSTPITSETLKQHSLLKVLELIREQDPPRPSQRLCSSHDSHQSISDLRQIQPARLRQILRGELDWIIMRAIEKDRARRYATPNDFSEDVVRYLTGDAVEARPPSATYRLRKFARRNRVGVVIAAGLILLVSASLIAIASYAAQTNVARLDAELALKDAKTSAQRSETILKIVKESFNSIEPGEGGNSGMSAKDVLLNAKASLDGSELDAKGRHLLIQTLATSFLGIGEFEQAIEAAQIERDLATKEFGPEHLETFNSIVVLASCLNNAGRDQEALDLLEPALEKMKKALGPDDPATLRAMNNFANSYAHLGQFDKSLEIRKQTHELMKDSLRPNHPDTLRAMQNMGSSYLDLGRPNDAFVLLEQTYNLMRKELGFDHPDTLRAMASLGNACKMTEQFDKALELSEEALKLAQDKLDSDHPLTLELMNTLAVSYADVGRTEDALKLYEQTFELRKKKLGPGHISTMNTMNNVAVNYIRAGRLDEAIALCEELLKLSRGNLGADHPFTFRAMNTLAFGYYSAGRSEEALDLAKQIFELRLEKLGPSHPDTFEAMGNLAFAHKSAGKIDDSIKINEKALELMRETLGPENQSTRWTMSNLADDYEHVGRLVESFELQTELLKILQDKFGREHQLTLNEADVLVWRLLRSPDFATKLEKIVGDFRSQVGGSADGQKLATLAVAEFRLGNFEAAISSAISSIDSMPNETEPVNLAILCMSHFKLGDVEKASEFRDQFNKAMKSGEYDGDADYTLIADELKKLLSEDAAEKNDKDK